MVGQENMEIEQQFVVTGRYPFFILDHAVFIIDQVVPESVVKTQGEILGKKILHAQGKPKPRILTVWIRIRRILALGDGTWEWYRINRGDPVFRAKGEDWSSRPLSWALELKPIKGLSFFSMTWDYFSLYSIELLE